MICLFTQGRHKEIKGVLEGERVREELSSHIWVDETHRESTLHWSGVSPSFFFPLSYSMFLYVSLSTLPKVPSVFPSIISIPLLHLFHVSAFYFDPIRTLYTRSSLLPLCLKRSQMLLYERQSHSVIFFSSVCYRKWASLEIRKGAAKEESHRVQGSTDRERT